MKARIKETGEIFSVEELVLGDGYNYELKDVELIVEEKRPIDYEHRRFELVKAVLQGMYANERWDDTPCCEMAEMAIEQADAVIAEYRKGGNQ